MFSANTQLQVSDLTFDGIKNNLKNFVKNKTEFEDYNFEGSTINYVLDILAYDTYMKSIYTNLAVNESYIDTAQVRSNVVSLAKGFGYTPKSAKTSVAKVILRFNPEDNPEQIIIPTGTIFGATKDGIRYSFVTTQEYNAILNFGQYTCLAEIKEGVRVEQIFTYSKSNPFYELINKNVDISTLIVGIKENLDSSFIEYHTRVSDITKLDNDTPIYYLQENNRSHFEVYFGDNVLGKQPNEGAQILISYVVTNGEEANGIQKFSPIGYTGYNFSDPSKKYIAGSVTTTEVSSFGSPSESIEEIRFNAINKFPIQGRLVTKNDFENFIRSEYDFVQSINVWGGEENNPPLYGKTILCLKPYNGFALTEQKKEEMVFNMKKRNVLSIEPVIVDPTFTFIVPEVTVNYDSQKTTNSADKIFTNVKTAILNYEKNELSNFGKTFRYSTFVHFIDKSDPSIVSNKTEIKYEKRFVPILNSTMTYKINFEARVNHPYDGYIGGLISSEFTMNTTSKNLHLEDDGFGSISIAYFSDNNVKTIFKKNVGTINYETGAIVLNALYFTGIVDPDALEISLRIEMEDYDLSPQKNNIILLSSPIVRIVDISTRQITRSDVIDATGNLSPIYTNNIAY